MPYELGYKEADRSGDSPTLVRPSTGLRQLAREAPPGVLTQVDQLTMEKQHEAAPDSISSVGVPIKEYPPSEVYSSEPPPAYVRPRHTAVQIARIAAVTLIAVSFILGFFMVASAYITATATCYQDYPVPQENGEDRPTYQHLVVDPLDSEESAAHHRQESLGLPLAQQQQTVTPPQDQQPAEQQSQEQPIQFKLPLQLDFDELAGSLIEKNQRSRMNCVVEKRRAEEVTDHQPRTVRLPFGVNISSDPRYEHITGERMAIFCESGNDQRHVPMEQQMTPIVVPIPVHHMPMPHHNGGMPQPIQIHPNALPHPGVQRGDALPPQVRMHLEAFHQQQLAQQHQQQLAQQHQQHIQQQMQLQQQGPPQIQIHPSGLPPHVIPQVPPQFHAHVFHSRPAQPQPQFQQQGVGELDEAALQQVGVALQQVGAGPDEEHQLIIQEEEMMPEGLMGRGGPEVMMGRGMNSQEQQGGPEVPADTVRPPPVPFQRLPVHHQQQPSQIMLHQQPPQPLQVQEAPQPRPHFVQPRSVRSVDSVLLNREKRVRRCACDCAC